MLVVGLGTQEPPQLTFAVRHSPRGKKTVEIVPAYLSIYLFPWVPNCNCTQHHHYVFPDPNRIQYRPNRNLSSELLNTIRTERNLISITSDDKDSPQQTLLPTVLKEGFSNVPIYFLFDDGDRDGGPDQTGSHCGG